MDENRQTSAGMRFKAAILVASDRAYSGERADETGPMLKRRLIELGYEVDHLVIVPDNRHKIVEELRSSISADELNLILISGGTGPSPNDQTPEATLEVIERRIPGMEEAMRHASLKITPNAMLSRGIVGVAGKSLIINLPGNPKGALENLQIVEPALEHALRLIRGEKADP